MEPTIKHSSHQNEEFSIRVFKNFQTAILRTLTVGGGNHPPLPHPTSSPAFGAGPGWVLGAGGGVGLRCWDPNLGPPQLFSRGCAPDFEARDCNKKQNVKTGV